MKRIAAVAAVLLSLWLAGDARALGPAGTLPAEPEAAGLLSVGGGLLHRTIRLVPRKANFPPIEVRQNHAYVHAAQSAYGWEIGGRLGAADFSDGGRFEAGYKPFVGIVVRGSLYGDRLSDAGLSVSLRADLYSRYRVADVPVGPSLAADVRVKDFWDGEASLLAHRRFGSLVAYAGPSMHYVEGKMYRTTASPVGTLATEKSYYRPKTLVGLAGGLSWQRDAFRLGIEGAGSSGELSAVVEASLGF